jgi:hypothetical protein
MFNLMRKRPLVTLAVAAGLLVAAAGSASASAGATEASCGSSPRGSHCTAFSDTPNLSGGDMSFRGPRS